jgi:5'-nucleotidase
MKVKRVLITSDDGFDSLGVRLLVSQIKNDYDLSIAGTVEQQSGVGGKANFAHGGKWGTQRIEGINALWVDGTPVDSIECAIAYFEKPFDLIVSGVNWGPNYGSGVVSSGTYSAAVRGIGSRLAPAAIALSWFTPEKFWFNRYRSHVNIPKEVIEYPGKLLGKMVKIAIDNDLWGSKLLNINFPEEPTSKAKFTKPLGDMTKFWPSVQVDLDENSREFHYRYGYSDDMETKVEYDVGAGKKGYISISPCDPSSLDQKVYQKHRNTKITL